jgi:hypothetical protein
VPSIFDNSEAGQYRSQFRDAAARFVQRPLSFTLDLSGPPKRSRRRSYADVVPILAI